MKFKKISINEKNKFSIKDMEAIKKSIKKQSEKYAKLIFSSSSS